MEKIVMDGDSIYLKSGGLLFGKAENIAESLGISNYLFDHLVFIKINAKEPDYYKIVKTISKASKSKSKNFPYYKVFDNERNVIIGYLIHSSIYDNLSKKIDLPPKTSIRELVEYKNKSDLELFIEKELEKSSESDDFDGDLII